MSTPELTLYYDGSCPFCAAEMRHLRGWDSDARLGFVDIAATDFDPAPLGVDLAALNREIHGTTHDGAVMVGIDTLLAAYDLVGPLWARCLVWPLRLRIARPVVTRAYRWFARNRYTISRRLGLRPPPACDGDVCSPGNPFLK